MNAFNKLKSYLQSGSADMCVRSHVIALALSLGVPGKPYQLLTAVDDAKKKLKDYHRYRCLRTEEELR